MGDERWLPIAGYEGLYEVSDLGRVRSLDRVTPFRNSQRTLRGKVLKPQQSGRASGVRYLGVFLSKDGIVRQQKVHRLVALAFMPEGNQDGMEVCHNDGDPYNNRLENLRWDTRSGNHNDKHRHGTDVRSLQTKCKWGHEFTPENTNLYTNERGHHIRDCRQCNRERWLKIRAAREARGEVVERRPWKQQVAKNVLEEGA